MSHHSPGLQPPAHRFSYSMQDLQNMASGAARGLVPKFSADNGLELVTPDAEYHRLMARCGAQEFMNLADDLLVICSELVAVPRMHWGYRISGWLYVQFRLDGLSVEHGPGGMPTTLQDESFLLSTSSAPHPFVREVLGETWRTVSIACRPSFLMRDLRMDSDDLPVELRRFHLGDPGTDFWYSGSLTTEMRDVVKAVLRPTVQASIRPVYMRAKVVELLCLAFEQLRRPRSLDSLLKLNHRDIERLREAHRLLRESDVVLSLDRLARHVGLNRKKLALGFKQVYGIPVGQYSREHRLERAKDLLVNQGISVLEAACVAMYNDAGSFTKAFLGRYGALPSTVRGTGPLAVQSNKK